MHTHDTDEGDAEGARWLHDPPFGAPGDARCPECSAALDAERYLAALGDSDAQPLGAAEKAAAAAAR